MSDKNFFEMLENNLKAPVKVVEKPRKPAEPGKRTKNWKEPTPDSEWRPEWKPRKTKIGTYLRGQAAAKLYAQEAEPSLKIFRDIGEFPIERKANGNAIPSLAIAGALFDFISEGGLMTLFCRAVKCPRSTLMTFIRRQGLEAEYEEARKRGCDALVEQGLDEAVTPNNLEFVTEVYGKDGELIRKDVQRGDSVQARKLAFQARMQVASKWNPEKYGDKIEVKTDTSTAQAIAAFRKRLRPLDVEDAHEV